MSETQQGPPTVKENAIFVATQAFTEKLAELGCPTVVLGVSVSEDAQGVGLFKVSGNSTIVLNLISALVGRLIPEDFHRLQVAMQHADLFATQRGDAPKPPGMVN